MILVIGGHGNMGQRYCKILKHLNRPYKIYDILNDIKPLDDKARFALGFIVATPTESHARVCYELLQYGKPILCEKPISLSFDEVSKLVSLARAENAKLQMVNQYAYMVDGKSEGLTSYNYFKHGPHGLKIDCINIVGLATGEIALSNSSPIWQCQINGQKLSLADVDQSYIDMVKDWLINPSANLDYIEHAHKKALELP